jgi:hypothetical protein
MLWHYAFIRLKPNFTRRSQFLRRATRSSAFFPITKSTYTPEDCNGH